MNKKRLGLYFFFGVFLLILYQLILILSPFFVAVLGAAIAALVLYPMHEYVLRRLRKYRNTAAGVSTALMMMIVILPMILLGWVFLKETSKIYPVAQHWMEDIRHHENHPDDIPIPPQILAAWEKTRGLLQSWNLDPQDILLKNLNDLSTNMTHLATLFIKNIAFIFFNIFVLVLTLFFFLRDGASIIHSVTELVPMTHDHKQDILSCIQNTLHAVLRGVLIISIIYGVLIGLGFGIIGVPFPVLLGALTTFLSPIPFIGPAMIWLPVAGGLFLQGALNQAVFVAIWSLLVFGFIDHFLRPIIIGTRAKMPLLLLFLGLLGGLRVYGFVGLLLGPLVMSLMLAFVNIYRQEYHWLLQEFKKSALSDG